MLATIYSATSTVCTVLRWDRMTVHFASVSTLVRYCSQTVAFYLLYSLSAVLIYMYTVSQKNRIPTIFILA